MKKIIFIFLFFSSLTLDFFAQINDSLFLEGARNKKKYTIAGIKITGADNTDKNVISLLSGLSEGDEIAIPGDKTQDAIKKLWKQSLFEDIQIIQEKIVGDKIYLIIHVVERPRLTKFSFKGDVRRGEADDIRAKIKLLKEKVVTDYMIGTIKNTVHDFYIEKGFYFNKVNVYQTKDTAAKAPHTILTIAVEKGKKVRIEDVNIIGNTVLKDWQLRRKLSDSKRFRWYLPFNSGKYLEENLKKDLPAIAEKYNTKGYRDARVIKDSVYFINDKRVKIDITIEEGHRFYFGKFSWFGNTKYRSGQLDTILNIHSGEVYNQSKLEQKLFMNPNGMDISSLYLDDGYLFFQVNHQESNVHNDTIDFEVMMYEGKQATINKVTVKGNDKTKDHVIYREIVTRPGQLFRRSDIIRTNRELAQLNYFDPEKINVVPTPNAADGTVDIEYTVEEKPSDEFQLQGGWGGRTYSTVGNGTRGLGVVGTMGLSFNNFSTKNMFKKSSWRPLPSGDGQKLSIRAQSSGKYYTSFNFSFTEPWFGGKKPNSLSFSAYTTKLDYSTVDRYYSGWKIKAFDPNKTKNPDYGNVMNITGLSLGFGKRLKWPDNFFNMYAHLNYNYYALNHFTGGFAFKNGYSNDVNLGINISRNSIDGVIYPKQGSNFVFTGQLTPPYSLWNGKNYTDLPDEKKYKFIEYQKYKFTAEWFTQLTHKKAAEGKEAHNLVLRTKVGYGILGYYSRRVGFAPFERFYMGGSGLSGMSQTFIAREIIAMRGYKDNSLSSQYGDPICSRYTMELRYPVSLNPQATIFMLGFAEAGNSWSSFRQFNPFQVKRSAGVGLRIFLPMFGLLGLDYGWGFDKVIVDGVTDPQNGLGHGQFHFTIGGTLGEL